MRIAVFPGSFDPFTRGHESVVRRACGLFDRIVIGVGTNTTKKYYFDLDKRKSMIEQVFKELEQVQVQSFDGLTVDFCREVGAQFILRGLRDGKDFFYENSIAVMNQNMAPEVETVFLLTSPTTAGISSTILREILRNNGDIRPFIPEGMKID
ncbi:MAG: pantetheine-phosphate adenylyltransferase [Flavobacteriales bacterium]|nr:pantetheine-phosphate adenylyltransferase [Flavobacteriales bacterium]